MGLDFLGTEFYFFGNDPILMSDYLVTVYTKNVVEKMSALEQSQITKLTKATASQLEGKTLRVQTQPTSRAEIERLETRIREFWSRCQANSYLF